jgi:hypothetical protein
VFIRERSAWAKPGDFSYAHASEFALWRILRSRKVLLTHKRTRRGIESIASLEIERVNTSSSDRMQ